MKKRKGIIAAVCVLSLLFGMSVHAADGASAQSRELDSYASLSVGGVSIVSEGKLTGDMPENVSYDPESNVLTLNNCTIEPTGERIKGISAVGMGDDFTIKLVGENLITGSVYMGIDTYSDTTILGPGSLTIDLKPKPVEEEGYDTKFGISASTYADLMIDGAVIDIRNTTNEGGYFYGITRGATYQDMECSMIIKNSDIHISSTLPSKSEAANSGIDAQQGDLQILNSNVDIEVTNGNIFGIGVGLIYGDVYGGSFTTTGSTIKCTSSTDMGSSYDHNMYSYEMPNAEQQYYYVGDGESVVEKSFADTFELGKYYDERYDTNYSMTIISPTRLAEYCNHTWNDGEVTKEATCTEKGEKTFTCMLCGEKKTEETAALGHDWSDWKILKEVDCTNEGSRTRTCSRCNEAETQTIEALGHDLSVTVTKQPTCTEAGTQAEKCSRCDYEAGSVAVPALGHAYEWAVTKEATFHEDGVKTGTCTRCGDTVTERIPKLSESHTHDFSGREEIVKAATCTETGSKNVYCTELECGEFETVTIPVIAHTPGEWTVVKEATCSESGLEQKTCTVCGAVTETQVTDTVPHTYGEWTVTEEATCTEAGVETAECTVCGEQTMRGINPLGHDYAQWKTTREATCTEDGEEESACTRCGEISTRVIEAAGHTFGDWKVVKEATAEAEGERQATCEVCGEVKTEKIEKLSVHQPTVPQDTKKESGSSAASGAKASDSGVPATGDTASLFVWILAIAAAAAGCAVGIRRKKQ